MIERENDLKINHNLNINLHAIATIHFQSIKQTKL